MEAAQSDIFEVGSLNTQTLHDAVSQFSTQSEFLGAEHRMCFHSTYMAQPEYHLTYNFDIDGLVVELERATALLAPIHYLLLPCIQVHMLQESYKFLKKHVDLTECTPLGTSALRHSCGYTIGYVEFQKELQVKGKDKSRPTIQKQISTNTSRCHVLKRDVFLS